MGLPLHGRVLIADDDAGIRLLLATSLHLRGFQVLEARNGREALAEMRAGNADLVIMDLMMPGVTGWDVLRARDDDPWLRRIPIIIITANNNREVTADVLGRHVCALISKPFDLDGLLTSVTAGLNNPNVCAAAA